MTDPWARPAGQRPVVEIELTGGDPVPVRAGDPSPADRRGGRRLALLLAGGAIAAVTIAGLTGPGDDDESSEATPATTFDPSLVTTPPTLGTLPPATLRPAGDDAAPEVPGRGDDPGVDAPDQTFPSEAVFDPATVTVPTFDVVLGVDADSLDDYDLLSAVGANARSDTPMRTTVAIEGIHRDGLFGNDARVVIAADPAAGRDSIRIDRNLGETARIVVDRTTQTVYRTDAGIDGRWEVFDGVEFVDGTGTGSLDALFDALAEGPLNRATIAAATSITADDELVRLTGGTIARRWHVVVPTSGLRPYGQLLLVGVSDPAVDEGRTPSEFAFDAYVTDQGRFALVTARFEVDDVVYAFRQFFDRRPANVRIELPDEALLLPRPPDLGP